MKKQILNIGKALNKAEQKSVFGGFLGGGVGSSADTCTLTLTGANGQITLQVIQVYSINPFISEIPDACHAAQANGYVDCTADCDLHHT